MSTAYPDTYNLVTYALAISDADPLRPAAAFRERGRASPREPRRRGPPQAAGSLPGTRTPTVGYTRSPWRARAVYVGGSFEHVGWGGGPVASSRRRRDRDGDCLGSRAERAPSLSVDALTVSGSELVGGGEFERLGGQERRSLAAVNIGDGAVTPWNPTVDGSSGGSSWYQDSTIYVGGVFAAVGGRPRESLAAVDATSGAALTWNPNVGSIFGGQGVRTLALSGSTVYADGTFSTISAQNTIPPSRPGRHHRARQPGADPIPSKNDAAAVATLSISTLARASVRGAGGARQPIVVLAHTRRPGPSGGAGRASRSGRTPHGPGGESARRSRVPMGELTEARGARARAAARLSPEAPQHLRALWPPRLRGSPALDRHSLVQRSRSNGVPSPPPSPRFHEAAFWPRAGPSGRGATGYDG